MLLQLTSCHVCKADVVFLIVSDDANVLMDNLQRYINQNRSTQTRHADKIN